MRILYSISNLGLGHATRSLPVIRHFLKENEVYILSDGDALNLLKKELKDENVRFISHKDYPRFERGKGLSHYFFLMKDVANIRGLIKKEHEVVERLVAEKDIDLCFSDCRYGCYSEKVPSFAIGHQVSFFLKNNVSLLQPIVDKFNQTSFSKFTKLLIPDYPGGLNLSGQISHPKFLSKVPHEYVGILSSVEHLKIKKDISYLFIISGFLREHVDDFVNKLMKESEQLSGKKVFVLGDMSEFKHEKRGKDLEVYSYAPIKLRDELLNRARVVVSRSGYTTVMDLIELSLKGVLIPTPNQSEQEYLADYLGKKKHFVTFDSQDSFSLEGIDSKLVKLKDLSKLHKTSESILKIDKIVREELEGRAR